jgi:anti-sigma factor RsiW
MNHMTCRDFVEFMMDYVSGALPEDVARQFETHIELCPPCVDFLKSYRTTVEMGRSLGCCDSDAPVPEDVPEELIQAILTAKRRGGGGA